METNQVSLEEAMQNQPTTNIGMIGHVSNGKSTITYDLTGTKTQRHASEQKRNITIRLGYANTKIYKCGTCEPPVCYQPHPSNVYQAVCKICDENMVLQRHISFVDCPGHNMLMATMLNGTCVMDTTVLVEAATHEIPAPQTREHLTAIETVGVPVSIVCLNKLDIVKKKDIGGKLQELEQFLDGTCAENSPVVPMCANHGYNTDVLCEYLCTKIPEPNRDLTVTGRMLVIRSFNVNKQNVAVQDLKGGVIGGSILQGCFRVGDGLTIKPGVCRPNPDHNAADPDSPRWKVNTISATVISINSEKNSLEYAVPGGLIGVQLDIDPALASNDGLIGNVATVNDGSVDESKVYETLFVKYRAVETAEGKTKVTENMMLTVNANGHNVKGKVVQMRKKKVLIRLLDKPVIATVGESVTLSSSAGGAGAKIIGRAEVLDGIESVIC